MAQPVLVRESTAVAARRLRREADAYDGMLLRRLEQRGEPPADFGVDAELPGEDEVLIDPALYHAAAKRTARARALVRRERLVLGGLVLAGLRTAAAMRS